MACVVIRPAAHHQAGFHRLVAAFADQFLLGAADARRYQQALVRAHQLLGAFVGHHLGRGGQALADRDSAQLGSFLPGPVIKGSLEIFADILGQFRAELVDLVFPDAHHEVRRHIARRAALGSHIVDQPFVGHFFEHPAGLRGCHPCPPGDHRRFFGDQRQVHRQLRLLRGEQALQDAQFQPVFGRGKPAREFVQEMS